MWKNFIGTCFLLYLNPFQASHPHLSLYKSLPDAIKGDPASTDSWFSGWVSPQWLRGRSGSLVVWCSPSSLASGKVQQVQLCSALSARESIRWLFLIDLHLLVYSLPFPHLHNPEGRGILNGLLEKILFLGMPSLQSLLKYLLCYNYNIWLFDFSSRFWKPLLLSMYYHIHEIQY